MQSNAESLWVILLAGGDGTRLHSLTTTEGRRSDPPNSLLIAWRMLSAATEFASSVDDRA